MVIKSPECLWNRHDTEPWWWPVSGAIKRNTWHFSTKRAHGQEKCRRLGGDWCGAGKRWVERRMTFNFRTVWCTQVRILQCCLWRKGWTLQRDEERRKCVLKQITSWARTWHSVPVSPFSLINTQLLRLTWITCIYEQRVQKAGQADLWQVCHV